MPDFTKLLGLFPMVDQQVYGQSLRSRFEQQAKDAFLFEQGGPSAVAAGRLDPRFVEDPELRRQLIEQQIAQGETDERFSEQKRRQERIKELENQLGGQLQATEGGFAGFLRPGASLDDPNGVFVRPAGGGGSVVGPQGVATVGGGTAEFPGGISDFALGLPEGTTPRPAPGAPDPATREALMAKLRAQLEGRKPLQEELDELRATRGLTPEGARQRLTERKTEAQERADVQRSRAEQREQAALDKLVTAYQNRVGIIDRKTDLDDDEKDEMVRTVWSRLTKDQQAKLRELGLDPTEVAPAAKKETENERKRRQDSGLLKEGEGAFGMHLPAASGPGGNIASLGVGGFPGPGAFDALGAFGDFLAKIAAENPELARRMQAGDPTAFEEAMALLAPDGSRPQVRRG